MSYTIADVDREVADMGGYEYFHRTLVTIGLITPSFTFGIARLASTGVTSMVFEILGDDGTERAFVHVHKSGTTSEVGAE